VSRVHVLVNIGYQVKHAQLLEKKTVTRLNTSVLESLKHTLPCICDMLYSLEW